MPVFSHLAAGLCAASLVIHGVATTRFAAPSSAKAAVTIHKSGGASFSVNVLSTHATIAGGQELNDKTSPNSKAKFEHGERFLVHRPRACEPGNERGVCAKSTITLKGGRISVTTLPCTAKGFTSSSIIIIGVPSSECAAITSSTTSSTSNKESGLSSEHTETGTPSTTKAKSTSIPSTANGPITTSKPTSHSTATSSETSRITSVETVSTCAGPTERTITHVYAPCTKGGKATLCPYTAVSHAIETPGTGLWITTTLSRTIGCHEKATTNFHYAAGTKVVEVHSPAACRTITKTRHVLCHAHPHTRTRKHRYTDVVIKYEPNCNLPVVDLLPSATKVTAVEQNTALDTSPSVLKLGADLAKFATSMEGAGIWKRYIRTISEAPSDFVRVPATGANRPGTTVTVNVLDTSEPVFKSIVTSGEPSSARIILTIGSTQTTAITTHVTTTVTTHTTQTTHTTTNSTSSSSTSMEQAVCSEKPKISFHLITNVMYGDARFQNLSIQNPSDPHKPTNPLLSSNPVTAARFYADLSTSSIAVSCTKSQRNLGLVMIRDRDQDAYGNVLFSQEVGTARVGFWPELDLEEPIIWRNDRFGSWLVCQRPISGVYELKWWDVITNRGIDQHTCAKVELLAVPYDEARPHEEC